ncbi:MAG: hypothetical protein WCF20_04545 [Methylovirgula sp.]
MEPWHHTFEAFMGGRVTPTGEAQVPVPALIATLSEPPWHGPPILMPDPRFATAVANRKAFSNPAHQVLLANATDGWQIIGGYIDNTLTIDQNFQGQGLSTQLILRCVAHRELPDKPRQVTIAGYRALLRAYLTDVRDAVDRNEKVAREVRVELLERISELRDISLASGSDHAYFKANDDKLTNPIKRPSFVEWEAEFLGLDEKAWSDLKEKFEAALTGRDGLRGWQQLFDAANEAKGYNYLSGIGCADIRFIPTSKVKGQKSPDLEATYLGRRVLGEVKTINKSQDELRRVHEGGVGAVTLQMNEAFFTKLEGTIAEATKQLKAFDEDQTALHYIFLNIKFDEGIELQEEYRRQVQGYLSAVEMPRIVLLD